MSHIFKTGYTLSIGLTDLQDYIRRIHQKIGGFLRFF